MAIIIAVITYRVVVLAFSFAYDFALQKGVIRITIWAFLRGRDEHRDWWLRSSNDHYISEAKAANR